MPEGIEVRVAKDGSKSYRASVWSNREQRRIRKTFPNLTAAKSWRSEAAVAVRAGSMRAAAAPRFEDIFGRHTLDGWKDGPWFEAAEAGTIRTRARRPFRTSTLKLVRGHYRKRVADEFGRSRLDQVTHIDLQEFVDELEVSGISPSSIEGAMLPIRLAYRWARAKGLVALDPSAGIEMPEKARKTRIPPAPQDAHALLATVPDSDRPIWAVAMLAGLRRGEILALTCESVDLKAGLIDVTRSWTPHNGDFTEPKSRNGIRKVPINRTLAPYLREHIIGLDRREGLLFGKTSKRPLSPDAIQSRADAAWKTARLERITLHACRHLYASMSIAAGINAHALCAYMGHSGIQTTYDLYGHHFPGNEAEASALLDGYLQTAFVAETAKGG